MKRVNKPWGNELIIENNELYCGKILTVNKGEKLSYQYHEHKDETMYVLEGEIEVHLEDKKITLNEGEKVRIKHLQLHRIVALKDSKIIEVSTHHDDSDTIRMIDQYGRE